LFAEAGAESFCPPVFMGFVGQLLDLPVTTTHRQCHISITLIARRSVYRVGCRQWRRGADLDSNVANFVETEQLVEVDGATVEASFVQVSLGYVVATSAPSKIEG
jgi:hypothetical protein